jgi:multicomponent Na+:H+ antiporter subunit B
MPDEGMTLIVRNTARLVTGFIAVFALYVAVTGHLSPGGGFPAGVMLAAAAVLVVLAFGHDVGHRLVGEARCHGWEGVGALAFVVIAVAGWTVGTFFANVLPLGETGHLASGGTIVFSNLAIVLKVGAGLAGAFIALAAFRAIEHREEMR